MAPTAIRRIRQESSASTVGPFYYCKGGVGEVWKGYETLHVLAKALRTAGFSIAACSGVPILSQVSGILHCSFAAFDFIIPPEPRRSSRSQKEVGSAERKKENGKGKTEKRLHQHYCDSIGHSLARVHGLSKPLVSTPSPQTLVLSSSLTLRPFVFSFVLLVTASELLRLTSQPSHGFRVIMTSGLTVVYYKTTGTLP